MVNNPPLGVSGLPSVDYSRSSILPRHSQAQEVLPESNAEKPLLIDSFEPSQKPTPTTNKQEKTNPTLWGGLLVGGTLLAGGVLAYCNRQKLGSLWEQFKPDFKPSKPATVEVPPIEPETIAKHGTEAVSCYSDEFIKNLQHLSKQEKLALLWIPDRDLRACYAEQLVDINKNIEKSPANELYTEHKQKILTSLSACNSLAKAKTEPEICSALQDMLSFIGLNTDGYCSLISKAQVELLTGVKWGEHNARSMDGNHNCRTGKTEVYSIPLYNPDQEEFLVGRVKVFSEDGRRMHIYKPGDSEYYQHARLETDAFWGLKKGEASKSKAFNTYEAFTQYLNTLPDDQICYLGSKGHMQVLIKIKGKPFIIQNYSNAKGVGVHPLKEWVASNVSQTEKNPFLQDSPLPEAIGFYQCFYPEKQLRPLFYERSAAVQNQSVPLQQLA